MLSTGIDLAAALMSVQQISPSDWGYVSKVCLQALLQSGSPNGFPSSSSQEQASADEASDFGLSLSTYPLEETVISSIPSTSSASDAASIRSSFTASLADASATDCRPSFDPANMMRPSVSLLLSSIVSKDPDSPPADSVPTPASPTASTAATDISSDNTVQSPAPSTPPQVHVDILSRSTSDFSVPTVSTQSYYREHTYISPPPAEPLINQCSQVSQSTNVLAQPPFRSSSSNEMVTSIRQPPKQTLRYIPYAVADRPPSLATKILTSSSFSFADQTFSPKPYVPSKCPATSTSNSERQNHSKVCCRKSKYEQLVVKYGISDHDLYYGWKIDYVTCHLTGCNQALIKNTRAEVTKHVKTFHLCAEGPQFVVRDCCPIVSDSERFIKVDAVYGHFQTERHSSMHNSYQYSCGHCGAMTAKPEYLDNHYLECRALRDRVLSLRSASQQVAFYPNIF